MAHSTLNLTERDLLHQKLATLIAEISRRGYRGTEVLLEHLKSAQTSLLGAMPEEYALSLEAARQSLPMVPEKELRGSLKKQLGELAEAPPESPVASVHQQHIPPHHAPPPGTTSVLWNFFDTSHKSFGTFYPNHYIVAAFPSFAEAREAETALLAHGFTPPEVMAVEPEALLTFFTELRAQNNLAAEIMQALSRMFATEAVFVEADVRRANQGAGFVVIYSPEEKDSAPIVRLVAPFKPRALHRYSSGGIESLI